MGAGRHLLHIPSTSYNAHRRKFDEQISMIEFVLNHWDKRAVLNFYFSDLLPFFVAKVKHHVGRDER